MEVCSDTCRKCGKPLKGEIIMDILQVRVIPMPVHTGGGSINESKLMAVAVGIPLCFLLWLMVYAIYLFFRRKFSIKNIFLDEDGDMNMISATGITIGILWFVFFVVLQLEKYFSSNG